MGLEEKQEKLPLSVGCAFPFLNLNCNVTEVIHVDTWEVKLCHEAPKLLQSLPSPPSLIVSSETDPLLLAAAQAVHSVVQEFICFYLCPSPPPAPTSPVREPFWFKYIFSLYMIKIKKIFTLENPSCIRGNIFLYNFLYNFLVQAFLVR